MSSGKKKQTSVTEVKPPDEFRGAFGALGNATEDIIGQIQNTTPFVAGFSPDERRAFGLTRGLSGSDPALGQAAGLFRSNPGVNLLRDVNVNDRQRRAEQGLRAFQPNAQRAQDFGPLTGFDSSSLRASNFGALRNFDSNALKRTDFDRLEQTADGGFLDVANNPFLADALSNAQRITTERFQQDVQPSLAAQFGGGFGLTGSSSINAQRRAADDLTRNLSEQATSTFADQFNRERGFQESARSQLANLNLSRAGQIDQNALSRASNLGQLDLSRAQGIDSNRLSRAQSLGSLGLQRAQGIDNARLSRAQGLNQSGQAFTGQALSRAGQIGQLRNQQAAGLANVGAQRRAQETQRIGLLGSAGAQQRALLERQRNAPIDGQLARLGSAGGIIGTFSGQSTSGGAGGGGGAGNILGGALTGGAAGFALGGPIGAGIGAFGGGLLGGFG